MTKNVHVRPTATSLTCFGVAICDLPGQPTVAEKQQLLPLNHQSRYQSSRQANKTIVPTKKLSISKSDLYVT